jgi:hypothetical protein
MIPRTMRYVPPAKPRSRPRCFAPFAGVLGTPGPNVDHAGPHPQTWLHPRKDEAGEFGHPAADVRKAFPGSSGGGRLAVAGCAFSSGHCGAWVSHCRRGEPDDPLVGIDAIPVPCARGAYAPFPGATSLRRTPHALARSSDMDLVWACLAGPWAQSNRDDSRSNGHRNDPAIRLLVSTLRRNSPRPRQTGNRPPSTLVSAVTNDGEAAAGGNARLSAAVIRPAWPVHSLWQLGPGRRQSPAPPQTLGDVR